MEPLEESKRPDRKVDRKVSAALKRIKALELRAAGWDYRSIAAEVGWKSPSSAHDAVEKELDSRLTQAAHELRVLEGARLDWMWRECVAVMEDQPHWKLWAIDRMLKIMERRAKLFGLDDRGAADVADQARVYMGIFEQAKQGAEDRGLPPMYE